MRGITRICTAALAALALGAPLALAGGAGKPIIVTQAPNGISDHSAKLRANIDPHGEDTTYHFELGTDTSYGSVTPDGTLKKGEPATDVSSTVDGLTVNTTYHFRVVAKNNKGTTTGPDQAFTTVGTPPDPGTTPPPDTGTPAPDGTPTVVGTTPTPEPALGRTVVAGTTNGTVLVREWGSSRWVPLTDIDSMPVNSVVDASHGTVALTTARGAGVSQTATFHGGMFQVRQSASGNGMTNLVLRGGSFASCPRTTARSSRLAVASKARKVRKLWSKDHNGRFRTYGRSSIATVRGTSWYTEDRCDGTLTRVRSGKVLVRNRRTGRTKLVTRGHSFLARAGR
jgi:hypothetical protein